MALQSARCWSEAPTSDAFKTLTWSLFLTSCTASTNGARLPRVIKGVTTKADARAVLKHGVDAIQVSNHGSCQLDGSPAAFDSLQRVAEEVQGQVPLIFDSGIRRGLDVFKALAGGADLVAWDVRCCTAWRSMAGKASKRYSNNLRTSYASSCSSQAHWQKFGLRLYCIHHLSKADRSRHGTRDHRIGSAEPDLARTRAAGNVAVDRTG